MGLSPALLKAFSGSGLLSPVTETGIFSYFPKLIPEVMPSLNSSSSTHCLVVSASVHSLTMCPSCPHLLQTWGSGQSITLCPSFLHLLHFSGSGQSAVP